MRTWIVHTNQEPDTDHWWWVELLFLFLALIDRFGIRFETRGEKKKKTKEHWKRQNSEDKHCGYHLIYFTFTTVRTTMIFASIRRIFQSFRTEEEERLYSRAAFFNLLGFLGSCVLFSFVAQRLSRHPRELAHIARADALLKAILS